MSSHGHQCVCVIYYAIVAKSVYNRTQGLLEVRFVAILVPASSICFSFVASFLDFGPFNLETYMLTPAKGEGW